MNEMQMLSREIILASSLYENGEGWGGGGGGGGMVLYERLGTDVTDMDGGDSK